MQYRLAQPDDIARLCELMNAQYARKKAAAYFRWQYFDSAWPTRVMCAVQDGRVMGMFGLQRRQLVGGEVVGQAIDLLLEPSLRGSGAFAELGRLVLEELPDLQAVCVLPNLNGKNACVKALGWTALGKIDALDWPTDRPLQTDALPPPTPQVPGRFAWPQDWLSWRFDRHPDYRYQWQSRVLTKLFVDPTSGRRFGDLVLPGTDPAGLAEAAAALANQGVERVTTWALPHTATWAALVAMGFVPTPQERYFCLKILDPQVGYLANWSAWSLDPGDAEFF